MLRLITETTITTVITSKKMVSFKGTLLHETMDTIYLIWNLIFSMVAIRKINNKIPFYALGDGHATIAMWPPS